MPTPQLILPPALFITAGAGYTPKTLELLRLTMLSVLLVLTTQTTMLLTIQPHHLGLGQLTMKEVVRVMIADDSQKAVLS